MITDYMEDLDFDNPFSHLKPWQKTPYEKQHGKNIYKNAQGKYYIQRIRNKERIHYGMYDTFQEALKARDELIRNGWIKEQTEEQKIKEYYRGICVSNNNYYVYRGSKYMGTTTTIEEALLYRDLCKENEWEMERRPKDMDLKTNNPYLEYGLDYPLPERLILPEKKPKRLGCISGKGKQFYGLTLGREYYGGYRTYEMAWYVREEMNKCGWDKSKLEQIVEDYPIWYTWLMKFYKFVNPRDNGWIVSIQPKYSNTGKLEHLYFYRLEDALWERDLLLKYDWNEELLIECADDSKNPYYDMELPPYPQRKVRNLSDRKDRTDLFNTLFNIIQEDPNLPMLEIAKLAGTNEVTIRNILKKEYDSDWAEFRTLCESGENPNEVLVQKPKIYKPDLKRYFSNTNYVSYYKDHKTPYSIYYRGGYYGAYPTRELANKISNDLQACNWDKSKLKEIQAKHGWQSVIGSKRWVNPVYYTSKKTGERYIVNYNVRKKGKGSFGTYKDKRVASLVRDLLLLCDWDKTKLDKIKDFAYRIIDLGGEYEGYQGYRLWGLSFL